MTDNWTKQKQEELAKMQFAILLLRPELTLWTAAYVLASVGIEPPKKLDRPKNTLGG